MPPDDRNGTYATFIKNLAQTVFYVVGIAGIVWAVAQWDHRSQEVVAKVAALEATVVTRAEFDRKVRGLQVRAKRLYNKNGWEYEEVE